MNKDELAEEFGEYAKQDIEGALQLITGLFIDINLDYCEIRGGEGDSKKQITIIGTDGQRKITIHAPREL